MAVLLKPVTHMNIGVKSQFLCSHVLIPLFHMLFLARILILFADPQHIAWPFQTISKSVFLAVTQTESPYLLICLAHQSPMPRLLANILDHILNCFVVFLVVNLESETSTLLQNPFSQ